MGLPDVLAAIIMPGLPVLRMIDDPLHLRMVSMVPNSRSKPVGFRPRRPRPAPLGRAAATRFWCRDLGGGAGFRSAAAPGAGGGISNLPACPMNLPVFGIVRAGAQQLAGTRARASWVSMPTLIWFNHCGSRVPHTSVSQLMQ